MGDPFARGRSPGATCAASVGRLTSTKAALVHKDLIRDLLDDSEDTDGDCHLASGWGFLMMVVIVNMERILAMIMIMIMCYDDVHGNDGDNVVNRMYDDEHDDLWAAAEVSWDGVSGSWESWEIVLAYWMLLS